MSPTKDKVKEDHDMLHSIATELEQKFESFTKKVKSLETKSRILADSLRAERSRSRSTMEKLLSVTTTQTEELIASFQDRFTQLKSEHDATIHKLMRISDNCQRNNKKLYLQLIKLHEKEMMQMDSDYRVALAEMEDNHKKSIVKVQQKNDASVKSLNITRDCLWKKLCALEDKLDTMKVHHQVEISKRRTEIDTMKVRHHEEKSKRRTQMRVDKSKRKKLEEEIHDLNNWIFELDNNRKATEANERDALDKYYNAVSDAQSRLHKWHQEREKRCEAEDKSAEKDKSAKKQLEMYAHLLEEFKTATADPKRSMQKEWDNEEAARHHGGKRSWPPWVVQLICELLVTGTPPSAIPQIIQTFC
jgi:hypothetical protein